MNAIALLSDEAVETPLQVAGEATGVFSLTWLLVALPLFGAGILLLGGRRTDKWGPYFGVLTVWMAFVIGALQFITMLGEPAEERAKAQELYTWASAGIFDVNVGFLVDQLSMVFVLLITFVGGLIHVYSLGYMSEDKNRRKFFGYLNLFVASMLLLVLANDYVIVYIGWEGVGLASYLLIGFWNQRPDYATAGNKAFVMNRVGDMGLAVADHGALCHLWNDRFCRCLRRSTRRQFGDHSGAGPVVPAWRHAGSRHNCRCRLGCWMPWPAPLPFRR